MGRMREIEERLEILETKFKELELPPKFEGGYQVLNISPCGDVNVGFIDPNRKPYYASDGWVYWIIDRDGKHIDNWAECDTVAIGDIRQTLLCKEE